MRIRFTVKVPKGTRKTFAIVKDIKYADGRREQPTVEDEGLEAINRNLLSGLIGLGDAEIQIRNIVKPRLERLAGIADKKDLEETVSEQNLAVFRKYWAASSRERKLKHPESSRNDLLAAIKSIEPLSLVTAPRDDLMDALNRLSAKRFRRRAIRINQLLKFLGREFKLPLKPIEQEEVHYVNWEELQQILPELPFEESRILAQVLFCTGVREGEAFQLTAKKLKSNQSIYVDKQLTRDFEITGLKNGKPHDTVLLPQGKEAYKKWCNLKEDDRRKLRNTFSQQLLIASRKVFADKDHHISSHDLRHSYAIYLLERGATVTEIAFMLGDTEAVVRKHYTGWLSNNRMVDNINALLKMA